VITGSTAPAPLDVAIVGGGLAGGLLAYRLATSRPELSIALFERGHSLGGVHTWSFHDSELDASQRQWVSRFVTARWPRHEVRFDTYTRTIDAGYASIRSATFADVVSTALGPRAHCGTSVAALGAGEVVLEGGTAVPARLVVDARGAGPTAVPVAWQKFLGLELRLPRLHGLSHPVLMDATVPQEDGFRFVYLLPWTPTRLLVEDTRYSDTPQIDPARLRAAVREYADRHGWRGHVVVAEELGALPLPLAGRFDDVWPDDGILRVGVAAGLGHPTTGYSLFDAVATAELLSRRDLADVRGVYTVMREFARQRWESRAFYRLLNRLLFRAAAPDARAKVLEHFYRRPATLLARFYGGRLTIGDRVRILSGRPPVSLRAAARALVPSTAVRG
jgi:lycopene beta-cyclase